MYIEKEKKKKRNEDIWEKQKKMNDREKVNK